MTVKKVTSADSAKAVERALARSTTVIHISDSHRQAILSKNASTDTERKP